MVDETAGTGVVVGASVGVAVVVASVVVASLTKTKSIFAYSFFVSVQNVIKYKYENAETTTVSLLITIYKPIMYRGRCKTRFIVKI